MRTVSLRNIPCVCLIGIYIFMWLTRIGLLGLVLMEAWIPLAHAQFPAFGSADDPREVITAYWWSREHFIIPQNGLSLIERQLRIAIGVQAEGTARSFIYRWKGIVRTGIFGFYRPDTDEWYDGIRTIRFIRYRPPEDVPFYLRIGGISRMRFGSGHLVNFYSSIVSWDKRTIGIETAFTYPELQIGYFTDDLRVNRVMGLYLSLLPLARIKPLSPLWQSLEIHFASASDRTSVGRGHRLTGYHTEASINLLDPSTGFFFRPYFSFAKFISYGSGIAIGLRTGSANLSDAVRLHLQLTLFYNSRYFIPGYFNTFYRINNGVERIIDADTYISHGRFRPIGITLEEARGGSDLLHELRVLFFGRFELWYQFKRHYGTQKLSSFHFFFFLYPRGDNRLRFEWNLHRTGLTSFLSIFSKLRNQHTLKFAIAYRYRGNLWLSLATRYTYRPVQENSRYFIVQRRFEPMVSLRIRFL